jgi:hypothetical protein
MPAGRSEIEQPMEEAQKASGPAELTGPLAAGFAAGGAQVFEMIRYREAPTTGLEPEKQQTTNIMRDAGLPRFRLCFPRFRRIPLHRFVPFQTALFSSIPLLDGTVVTLFDDRSHDRIPENRVIRRQV